MGIFFGAELRDLLKACEARPMILPNGEGFIGVAVRRTRLCLMIADDGGPFLIVNDVTHQHPK